MATRYLETSFLADLQSINKIKMIEFNDELVVCVSGGLRDMFNVTCFIGDITESNERLNFREKRGSQSVLKNCSDFQKSEYDFSLFPLNKNTVFVSCSTETNLTFNLLTPINDSFKILGYSSSVIRLEGGNYYEATNFNENIIFLFAEKPNGNECDYLAGGYSYSFSDYPLDKSKEQMNHMAIYTNENNQYLFCSSGCFYCKNATICITCRNLHYYIIEDGVVNKTDCYRNIICFIINMI